MTPERRDPAQPLRRTTDWSRKRLLEWGSLIVIIITIATFISGYFSSRWASHAEVKDAVSPVLDTLSDFRRTLDVTDSRLQRVERGQAQAESIHQLLIPMARLQCLDYARQRSLSLADAAGLPCDSLLRRMR